LPEEYKKFTKIYDSNFNEIAYNKYEKYDGYYKWKDTYTDSRWDWSIKERVYFQREIDRFTIHYDIWWDDNSLWILLDDNTFLETPNWVEIVTNIVNINWKKILFFDQWREIWILEDNNKIHLIKRPKCIFRFLRFYFQMLKFKDV